MKDQYILSQRDGHGRTDPRIAAVNTFMLPTDRHDFASPFVSVAQETATRQRFRENKFIQYR